jgi:prepilin-type N-terminal cleavage/methylation domain-containing protein
MINKKGFTIIELIVVIAVIAVLAGIVLVNVTQYLEKGKIAAVKGNMSRLRTVATQYFEINGNFASFCLDPAVSKTTAAIDKIEPGGLTGCASRTGSNFTMTCTSSEWIYVAFLLNFPSGLWCVDYTGAAMYVPGLAALGTCKCSNS